MILALSFLLEMVRVFFASPRLLGYGMLVAIAGCAPLGRSNWRWLAYSSLTLVASILNAALTHHAGANDPRYAILSREAAPYIGRNELLFSNSYRILDIQLGRHAVPITEWPKTAQEACVVQILLPNLDEIAKVVWSLSEPPPNWNSRANLEAGKVFCNKAL